jgi:hypothetical protein
MGTTASGLQRADNCNCIRLMDLVLASWVFRERAAGIMNRTHCLIHITGGLGGTQDLDSLNRTHVFIHRILRFGSSQVLDYINRIDCVPHRLLGLGGSQGLDYMDRIHGLI